MTIPLATDVIKRLLSCLLVNCDSFVLACSTILCQFCCKTLRVPATCTKNRPLVSHHPFKHLLRQPLLVICCCCCCCRRRPGAVESYFRQWFVFKYYFLSCLADRLVANKPATCVPLRCCV